MAMKNEKGQSIAFYAILMVVMAAFILGLMDYLIANARMMEAIAVADLAAHAGAQEITLLPDGTLTGVSQGSAIAADYFLAQAPGHTHLVSVACGRFQGQPGCWVQAQVRTPGYILPERLLTLNAVGYLAHGVTRGDQ